MITAVEERMKNVMESPLELRLPEPEEVLREVTWLKGMSDDVIGKILNASETRVYNSGDALMKQGDSGDGLIVITGKREGFNWGCGCGHYGSRGGYWRNGSLAVFPNRHCHCGFDRQCTMVDHRGDAKNHGRNPRNFSAVFGKLLRCDLQKTYWGRKSLTMDGVKYSCVGG